MLAKSAFIFRVIIAPGNKHRQFNHHITLNLPLWIIITYYYLYYSTTEKFKH